MLTLGGLPPPEHPPLSLTVAERHLLAPDAALPFRDLLLDQDAAGEHLARLLGRAVADCELVRVKYRIGESLRATYRLDGVELLTARAFRRGESGSAYRKAAGPGVRHDPALDAVWWTFPADRRLRGLGDVLTPAPDLAALLPGWVSSELVEYSPERAATFRAVDAAGTAVGYAKAYAIPGSRPRPGSCGLRATRRSTSGSSRSATGTSPGRGTPASRRPGCRYRRLSCG